MKTITFKFFVLAFTFFMANIANGQTSAEIFNAFTSQNYDVIKGHLDNSLDVCIEDVQQYNKKEVAITRIKDYLTNNPIAKWEPMHQGSSKKSSSNFHIARIQTKAGVRRLFIYLEKGEVKNIIKEVRIEKL